MTILAVIYTEKWLSEQIDAIQKKYEDTIISEMQRE